MTAPSGIAALIVKCYSRIKKIGIGCGFEASYTSRGTSQKVITQDCTRLHVHT